MQEPLVGNFSTVITSGACWDYTLLAVIQVVGGTGNLRSSLFQSLGSFLKKVFCYGAERNLVHWKRRLWALFFIINTSMMKHTRRSRSFRIFCKSQFKIPRAISLQTWILLSSNVFIIRGKWDKNCDGLVTFRFRRSKLTVCFQNVCTEMIYQYSSQ
jgi:hypothetical protein